MLSAPPREGAAPRPPHRPPRALRRDYEEFLLQRIEEYKNSVSRAALMSIGDEAIRELEASAQGQYLLTEVLLLEHVDRVIARRLRLPSFARWRDRHRALRAAQREPTHWGLDARHPLVTWARRLEPGDQVVVVGSGALPAALFLAAHDAELLLVDQALGAVESAEQRAVTEQLAGRFHALVVTFGGWLPDVLPSLVVVDPAALAQTRRRDRQALIGDLQERTPPDGAHVVLGAPTAPDVIPLAPDSLRTLYAGWDIEPGHTRRSTGFTATKPRRRDTALNVSD
jgi:hypothetical protein